MKLDSKSVDLIKNNGLCHYFLGCYDAALNHFITALGLDPKSVHLLNLLGITYFSIGRYDEAFKHFNQGLEIDDSNIYILNNLGLCNFHLGKYTTALEYYDKAIEKNPLYEDPWWNKGDLLLQLNKLDEALSCYQNIEKIGPNYLTALNKKSIELMRSDFLDRAFFYCNKSLELNTDNPVAWLTKSVLLIKTEGDLGQAKYHYWKAMAINPNIFQNDENSLLNDIPFAIRQKFELQNSELIASEKVVANRLKTPTWIYLTPIIGLAALLSSFLFTGLLNFNFDELISYTLIFLIAVITSVSVFQLIRRLFYSKLNRKLK